MTRYMTYDDFRATESADAYYAGRWGYYSAVLATLRELSPPIENVLEIGPYKLPIVTDSDTMDCDARLPGITYLHNASIAPWPIPNKAYDLVVALQVWEHLNGKQADAFREVVRVARRAVLSLPYQWDFVDPLDSHYGITDDTIARWTGGIVPRKTDVVRTPTKRIILYYEFGE